MTIRRRGCVAAALSGVLIALCLAGCSSATPPPQAAALPPAATAPVAATSTSSPPGDTRRAGDQCRLDDLSAQYGDGAYAGGLNQVRVIWTNRSGRTCTMTGFGGVDLINAQGQRLSTTRSTGSARPVSLPPGGTAHTTISYPAAGGTGVFKPVTILATPPDETHSARLPWGAGAIPTFEAPTASDNPTLSPVQPNVS